MARSSPPEKSGETYTAADIDRIYDLVAAGKTLSFIAKRLKRSQAGIQRVVLEDLERYGEAKAMRADLLREPEFEVATNPEHKHWRYAHERASLIHRPEYREALRESQAPPPPAAPPLVLEGGRRPVSIADVAQLASELGIRIAIGVDGGDARGALPAAEDVLPDPPAD